MHDKVNVEIIGIWVAKILNAHSHSLQVYQIYASLGFQEESGKHFLQPVDLANYLNFILIQLFWYKLTHFVETISFIVITRYFLIRIILLLHHRLYVIFYWLGLSYKSTRSQIILIILVDPQISLPRELSPLLLNM